jgi:hypothetical protein
VSNAPSSDPPRGRTRSVHLVSDRARLTLLMGAAVLLASAGTYLLVAVLGIQTAAGSSPRRFGGGDGPASVALAGSSLTYDGVSWSEVASFLGTAIESWPVPGSSPAEWEQLQRRFPQARMTFIGVSLYDLNEAWLCDFRANIVPLGRTLADLRESGSDLTFARRLLNCYPRAWVRRVFPTAGRADRVIFGFRDKARDLIGEGRDLDGTPRLRLAADYTSEDRIGDWPRDRMLRRLASMRAVQGVPGFFGPKHLALRRLLQQASRQGVVVVIVLPVSPPYLESLIAPREIRQFEASLDELRKRAPAARWVRVDRIPSLDSTDYFYDLVHLNMEGRRIASDGLLSALAGMSASR